MKHKPLQIDWDELETAFENRNEDLTYYLDLVTGQVILEGEGEDAHFDEDAEMDDAVEGDAAMSPALKQTLSELVAEGPSQKFKDELRHHPDVRARWFLFRSERLHEVMDAWMESNRISPASPPPWK
jgi:hypothetical protein